MSLTLASTISDAARLLTVTGTVPDEIGPGYRFRLGDELLELADFARAPITTPITDRRRVGRDVSTWIVERGLEGSTRASHASGTAVDGATDAFTSSSTPTPPGPFLTGGSVTPAAFVEPTTATPEAIANALIDAGLMASS